jgi:branched-chain amino acid transport system substrate-binding protein
VENGAAHREIIVRATDEDDAGEPARVAAEILAYRPHLLISNIDFPLAERVERGWPRGQARPLYVGHVVAEDGVIAADLPAPDLQRRVFAVDTVSSTPAVAKFVLHYNRTAERKLPPTGGNSGPYDGFYVAAYAAAALGAEPITGPRLARALGRLLPPGEPVDVGPGGIYAALNLLAGGKNVDLQGTLTTLDFDPETGDVPADFAILCAGPAGYTESGLVYRARSRSFEGSWKCGGR